MRKVEKELNTISEEKLEEGTRINTIPDEKGAPNGGGKPGAVKDMRGYWTDKQIRENPIAYIKYLEKQLEGKHHADEIKKIMKIKSAKKLYLERKFTRRVNLKQNFNAFINEIKKYVNQII